MNKGGKVMKMSLEEGSSSGSRRFGKSPALVPCKTKNLRDGEQKMLYLLFSHPGGTYSHSLYAVDPLLDAPPAAANPSSTATKIINTTITTTISGRKVTSSETSSPHSRQSIEPVLCFHRDAWPSNMSCAAFGKKLYFIGGMKAGSCTRKVHVLDLSTTTNLLPYREFPTQILKPAPKMNSGKIRQQVFVNGSKIFVLSGQRFNTFNGKEKELHQLEFIDLASKKPKWKVGAAPPFTNSAIGPFTIIDDTLLIYARERAFGEPPEPRLYSYHLKEDRWDDFDPTPWTKVTKSRDFFFCSGAKPIGKFLFTTFGVSRDAIPVVIRLEKKDDSDNDEDDDEVMEHDDEVMEYEGEEEEVMEYEGEEDYYEEEEVVDMPDHWFDVIGSIIECRMLSSTLVELGTGDRMAFLQAGNPLPNTDNPTRDFNEKETHISLSFFDIIGGQTPTYVTSSHYVTRPGRTFIIAGAHLV